MSAARRIGILAGGGSLPREVADAVVARGLPLHIVAIDGEADADFGPYPVTRVNWGEIGRMVATFQQSGCTDLVIIGSVTRPDLATIKPDLGFFKALGTIAGLVLAGGDDGVLRGVIRFFERHGLTVVGPTDVAPELTIGAGGPIAGAMSPEVETDARVGFGIIAALGRLDIGQAAVVSGGRLEALEAAEGTDRMLERLAEQRRAAGHGPVVAQGVLIKRTKPGQDLRIDLPVIGPETVRRAVACGLAGIVVEAGRALAADRGELQSRAAARGLTVAGMEIDPSSEGRNRAREQKSVSMRLLHNLKARRAARGLELRPLGRHKAPARVLRDVMTSLQVMTAMRPIGGARAVVVVRGHVLAVETGEGVAAALSRAAGLRQWGDRRLRRRAGIAAIDAGRDCEPDLIEIVAKAGFAGIVVKLRRFTAGVPTEAIAAADKAGVFIVGIAAEEAGDG